MCIRDSLKNADQIIISNEGLKEKLEPYSTKLIALPDKLPSVEKFSAPEILNSSLKAITLISSFARDEPIEEFIKGFKASRISETSVLYITGKKSLANELLQYEDKNLVFTDYLSEEDYLGLLQNSSLIVDLTTLSLIHI